METKYDSANFEPEKEYIKTLELSVQMLQREISLLRYQQSKISNTDIDENKFLVNLKDLVSSITFGELKEKLDVIFNLILDFYDFELFIYDNQNLLYNTNDNINTLLNDKIRYLEEEGIINWAMQSDDYSYIKDLTISPSEKDLYFIIIPIKLNNQNKGILVISTPNSKDSLSSEAINLLIQLPEFLSFAVDNIESNIQIQNMNKRLQLLNNQVVESSYLASISGLLKSMIIEIQQPILIMESNFKLIESGIDNSKKRFDIINEQISKLSEIYDFFKKINVDNSTQIQKVRINLSELLIDNLGMIGSQLKREGIVFDLDISDNNIFIECFPTHLGHAIISIVMFLSSRNDDIGSISINLSKSTKKQAIITFIDNGVGLSEDELLFLQFSENSDLSFPFLIEMQYIYKVIELNNGKMYINSELNKGTSIKLIFSIV